MGVMGGGRWACHHYLLSLLVSGSAIWPSVLYLLSALIIVVGIAIIMHHHHVHIMCHHYLLSLVASCSHTWYKYRHYHVISLVAFTNCSHGCSHHCCWQNIVILLAFIYCSDNCSHECLHDLSLSSSLLLSSLLSLLLSLKLCAFIIAILSCFHLLSVCSFAAFRKCPPARPSPRRKTTEQYGVSFRQI